MERGCPLSAGLGGRNPARRFSRPLRAACDQLKRPLVGNLDGDRFGQLLADSGPDYDACNSSRRILRSVDTVNGRSSARLPFGREIAARRAALIIV